MMFKTAKALKMLAAVIVAVIAAFLFDLVFSGLEKSNENGVALSEIVGVSVESVEVVYDGQPHGVLVSGVVPNDIISYSSDGSTWQSAEPKYADEGEYTVFVKIERGGCVSKTLRGTVEIRAAILNGVSSCNRRIIYDGNSHLPNINGITSGDKITYSLDGEAFSDNVEIIGVGEYVVYYRVQRGFARYMDSCRIEIVPDITGTYYNEDALDTVEITEETMYDASGRGILLGREFYADGDVLVFDGTAYKRMNADEKIYTLTINGETARVLGGEELAIDVRFDEFGATITAENKVIKVPNVNYCEYVTGSELITYGSVMRVTDDAVIQLSYRQEQDITVQNKYVLHDGNEHCIIPNTDAAVKVNVNGEYADAIPKYSEEGIYRYEFLFEKDGYLPKKVTAELIIYPSLHGGYILGNSVIAIDGTDVLLNNVRTTLVLDSDGMKINGETITVTDDGIIYKDELYSKTKDNNLVISVGGTTFMVSTTETGVLLFVDNDRGYFYTVDDAELIYEFEIPFEVTEVRLNSETAIASCGNYYVGVSDFFLGFAWIELL